MESKYILELTRKEVVMLGQIVFTQQLYQTSYEPLRKLCNKIDNICVDILKEKKNESKQSSNIKRSV